MRVLHLSKYDTRGGAALAALNSVRAQRVFGIDARLAVARKLGCDDFVDGPEVLGRLRAAASFAAERLPFRALGIERADVRSLGLTGLDIRAIVKRHEPNVVVLHGVDGFVPLTALPQLSCPIVWRMHDMWPALGSRHYATDDEVPAGVAAILDRWTLNRKKRAYRRVADLTLCPPSEWLGRVARASPLLNGRRCVVIPNGVDANLFSPGDRQQARRAFGLSPDLPVVVFGAVGGTSDPRKGGDLLLDALREGAPYFKRKGVQFLLYGGSRERTDSGDLVLISAGPITSRERMAMLYRCADLVVVPSRMENLSLTVLEAMATAVPVLAFDVGGMPDIIDDDVSGWLAREVSPGALLARLRHALEQIETGHPAGGRARKTIEARFTLDQEASSMAELYRGLVDPELAPPGSDRETSA